MAIPSASGYFQFCIDIDIELAGACAELAARFHKVSRIYRSDTKHLYLSIVIDPSVGLAPHGLALWRRA